MVAKGALLSVVLIRTGLGVGTGFVVGETGTIVVPHKVVASAKRAVVELPDGRRISEVFVVASDKRHGLVLLKAPGVGLPSLPLADGDVALGSHVTVLGSLRRAGDTSLEAQVSGGDTGSGTKKRIEISPPMSSPISGGSLLDEAGRVIGAATHGAKAVHVDHLRWLLANAWRSVPIAEFDWTLSLDSQLRADSTRPEAPRPEDLAEDLALLAGCSREARGRLKGVIAPARADHEETFRRYERAMLRLLDDPAIACPAAKEMLRQALERARMVTSHGDEAEVLREAAHSLLEAIDRVDVVDERSEP